MALGAIRRIIERKANFHAHLPMIHFAFNNVAADFLDLKPAQVVQAMGGPFNRVGDGIFKGFLRGTHDFYFLVYMITHMPFIKEPIGEATLKPNQGR